MSQSVLTSFFGGKGQKRQRDEGSSALFAGDKTAAGSTSAADQSEADPALSGVWTKHHFPDGSVPGPTAAELESICTKFLNVASLTDFSQVLASVQPDFSGRVSGLSRALQWDSAPCNETKFLKELLPFLANRAREIRRHFPAAGRASKGACVALPIMRSPAALTMSRAQALSLLSAQFLGILPFGSPTSDEDRGDCNMAVFSELIRSRGHEQVAKLQCYLQYFVTHMHRWQWPDASQAASYADMLCFRRCSTKGMSSKAPSTTPSSMPCFQAENALNQRVGAVQESEQPLQHVDFVVEGGIENAVGSMQVDFANKYIGGGALGHGSVQEEIRFAICPELAVSCLLFSVMGDTDAIIMTGVEQTARYSGYGRSLRFDGPHHDSSVLERMVAPSAATAAAGSSGGTSSASTGSARAAAVSHNATLYGSCVVAIDAVRFHPDSFELQISPGLLHRELFKALAGFGAAGWESNVTDVPSVATGKWGCGVFNGCNTIKLLVQWIAASHCSRKVLFYVFDGLPDGLQQLVCDLESASVGTACVWGALLKMHQVASVKGEASLILALTELLPPKFHTTQIPAP